MSVVSASQFALSRTRKELNNAFKNSDWKAIKDVDKTLSNNLNEAFDDKDRDTRLLIDELEKIVQLYGEMVSNLPDTVEKIAKPQDEG